MAERGEKPEEEVGGGCWLYPGRLPGDPESRARVAGQSLHGLQSIPMSGTSCGPVPAAPWSARMRPSRP